MSKVMVALTRDTLDPIESINFVKDPRAGAVVYFGGTTRDNVQGKHVQHLSYESYEPLALKTMEEIATSALSKWSIENSPSSYICKVSIKHRLGVVPVMEDSIIITVSAGHRQRGWEAAQWILEEMKSRAEIWKNETYSDGSYVWQANNGVH
jgi:molybdopterin synthase catalytic subunit